MNKNQTLPKINFPHLSTLRDYPGLLIAVEGIDGSGKSTQLMLVNDWLRSNGFATVMTAWSSSETIHPLIKQIKREERIVTPEVYSLLNAADFAEQYEKTILPALKAGLVVLCDRYIYTAFTRDKARGLDQKWVRKIYSFARIPDITLYFHVDPEVSLKRKIGIPNFYEAGMDVGIDRNIKRSFAIFEKRVIDEYQRLTDPEGIIQIDGTHAIFETFPVVKEIIATAIRQKYQVVLS